MVVAHAWVWLEVLLVLQGSTEWAFVEHLFEMLRPPIGQLFYFCEEPAGGGRLVCPHKRVLRDKVGIAHIVKTGRLLAVSLNAPSSSSRSS